MDLARTVYSRDLKIAVMRAMEAGSSTGETARKYQLSPKLLDRWRAEWRAKGGPGVSGSWAARRWSAGGGGRSPDRRAGAQDRPADDGERLFKKSLAAFQGASPAGRRQWRGCLFEEIQQAASKGQAVNALCQMTGLNRAGFYRWRLPIGHLN